MRPTSPRRASCSANLLERNSRAYPAYCLKAAIAKIDSHLLQRGRSRQRAWVRTNDHPDRGAQQFAAPLPPKPRKSVNATLNKPDN
jgi:hypothetical protein